MAINILPSQDELVRLFDYDPQTGELRWRRRDDVPRKWNTRYAGSLITYQNDSGYICVRLGGKLYRAHRIIWKMVIGSDPKDEIDHENLNRSDNRWDNLREATSTLNKANHRKHANNSSGLNGAYQDKRDGGGWYAQIQISGVTKHLGRFKTAEMAHAAYASAAQELFGNFARSE